MKSKNPNKLVMPRAVRTPAFFVLAGLIVIAGASEVRATTVWNKNQTYLCGTSPASIPSNYETFGSCGPICPGTPINIVYGISDPAGSSTQVTVKITLPPTFSPTSAPRAVKFPGGTPLSTQPTVTTLANGTYSIGALTSSNDHVIIVIDGYFTQAASYTILFAPSRSDLSTAQTSPEATTLNINAICPTKPKISIKKEVEALPSGSYGPSASVTYGTSVRFRITVTNTATTDIYLGGIASVTDSLGAPNANDVPLDVTISNYQCASSAGAASMSCPPGSTNIILYRNNSLQLPTNSGFAYPSSSNGLLPAGGSFTITFDVLIKSPATCSPSDTNSLTNYASFNYSGSSLSTSSATVNLTGLKPTGTPCPTPPPTPALTVTKKITNPTTGVPPYPWGSTLTYQIQFTNSTSAPITGIVLYDQLYGNGTPAFTATFSPSNVNCSPATCTSINPAATSTVAVGSNTVTLFWANIASLGAGQTETVTYQVKYDAPCGDVNTSGDIENRAVLGGTVTGASTYVPANMPAVSLCALEVDKTETTGVTAFSSYPQNLSYHVVFKNNSAQAITVGTVVDSIILDSPGYGNVPIGYSCNCTSSSVTIPITASPLIQSAATSVAGYNTSSTYGNKLLNFSGSTFQAGGYIDCTLNVTLKQPSTTDSLCEGNGKKHNVINAAYMNLLPGNYNPPPTMSPVWYQKVTTPLPDCLSILVGKTAPATVTPGGAITFTLTVTNTSNDPVSSIVVQDAVPAAFTNVTWTCASGCSSASGSGNNINVPLTPPLAPGATVTILVNAIAPSEPQTKAICNDVYASPSPFPPHTYFEGDHPDLLTHAQACIQVVSNGSPTPTPTASPVDTGSPTPTPTPTPTATPGCAQVTGDARCLPNGGYSYTFAVKNNSGSVMSQILLTPVQGSTFTLAPQLTNLPTPLQNGQSTTVTTNIGNVKAGDKVCFFVSLMADKAPCCIVQVCPTLPRCGEASPTPTVTSSLPPTLRQQRPPPPSRRGKQRP